MPELIDLHTHSTASDGTVAPAELIRLAAEAGLDGISLTDHDTVSGLDEFLAEAEKHDLKAVPGLELSSLLFSKELHIVGLFIDRRNPKLLELLEKIRQGRTERNEAIVLKCRASGYEITMEELHEIACGESIGRPHIAEILVRKGYFETIRDVFEQCLKRGCRCYVPRPLPSSQEAVGIIHEAGGLAIWAHPVSGQSGERAFVRKMLKHLIPAGLDGMEVRYSMFSEAQTRMLTELAEENHLCKSGGSDFHGERQPGIQIGIGTGNLSVPTEYLDALMMKAGKI